MTHRVQIKKTEHINHNVLHLVTDKPEVTNLNQVKPQKYLLIKTIGQDKKRQFTFTSLPENKELEFTIKLYPSHDGVTEQLIELQVGDYLLIGDSWGAINYQVQVPLLLVGLE